MKTQNVKKNKNLNFYFLRVKALLKNFSSVISVYFMCQIEVHVCLLYFIFQRKIQM